MKWCAWCSQAPPVARGRPVGSVYEGSDTTVLFDALAYGDVLPLTWKSLPGPLDPLVALQWADHNLRLLQACAAIEERGTSEKPDETAPHAADLMRLDLKLNLMLDLIGQLLIANHPRPPAASVRFNALGAIWQASGALPRKGERGVFEVYLRECLVQPLRLVGTIDSVEPGGLVEARFDPSAKAIADLVEKLAFRRHRRLVAHQRQPRRT
jgi:hypothetical protein